MPCSNNPALEQAKSGFYGIGMNVATNVDFVLVAHGLMGAASESSFHHSFWIGGPFVGHNHVNMSADIFLDVLGEGSRSCVFGVKEPQLAATLTDTDNDLFVVLKAAPSSDSLATDIGFIHLNLASEERLSSCDHGSPDAMAEIPCGLVGSLEHALELIRRHALARLTEQVGSEKPLPEG